MSEINSNKIDLTDRFDAEYFQKKFLKIENALNHRSTLPLCKISKVVASAFYPAATQLYNIGNMPFIRCVDCINYPLITLLQNTSFEKIPEKFAINNNGIRIINDDDIVITKVGTPCFSSIIKNIGKVALSRTVMGLTKIESIQPEYLLIFLRCKYGFDQLYRSREQTIQFQLTVDRINKIKIFIPSKKFQTIISNIVTNYYKLIFDANKSYDDASNLLLKYIKFDNINFSNEQISIKRFSESFIATGRLDAEYYQNKYYALLTSLSNINNSRLGNLVTISKSIEPGSEYYGSTGVQFIRVSDLTKFGISNTDIKIPPTLTSLRPKKNTILLSKDGSVGIPYKCDKDYDVITSGALLHLTLKDKSILPDYLTLVLNSPAVQQQAKRDVGGSIIQHWKPSEIENVLIPILDLDKQSKLSIYVQKAFSLFKKAKDSIGAAQHAVELAIKKNENFACQWLISNKITY